MHAHLFCVMYTIFSSPVQLLTEEKERLVKRKEAAKISELETEALLLRTLLLIILLSELISLSKASLLNAITSF